MEAFSESERRRWRLRQHLRTHWFEYVFQGFGCFAACFVVLWQVLQLLTPLTVAAAALIGAAWGALSFRRDAARLSAAPQEAPASPQGEGDGHAG